MIAIDLSKLMPDADAKVIQQINFTGNIERDGNTTMFSILKKTKRNNLDFFTRYCESIVNLF